VLPLYRPLSADNGSGSALDARTHPIPLGITSSIVDGVRFGVDRGIIRHCVDELESPGVSVVVAEGSVHVRHPRAFTSIGTGRQFRSCIGTARAASRRTRCSYECAPEP